MTIDLVFITYNRLDYTKLALASILADPKEQFSLTIWDNASTDGTTEYLRNEINGPRIADVILSKENIGQIAVVNEIWGRSKADLLGKLDNDCLMTPGWTRTLAKAHRDIDNLGVVACWNFFPDEFHYERAKHKIQRFGKHQIFRHPWTCGTGLLIKRDTFLKFGAIRTGGTTSYWLKMALAGYINGFYYPLIYQEHMDDIRSKYSRVKSMSFQEAYRYTPAVQAGQIRNLRQYNQFHQEIVENILTDPYDPKYYVGWQAKLRRILNRARKMVQG
jgi:glycosyltransferase involved in cell wall biosynthesis